MIFTQMRTSFTYEKPHFLSVEDSHAFIFLGSSHPHLRSLGIDPLHSVNSSKRKGFPRHILENLNLRFMTRR